tara:strand:+ start:693 stop:2735 length:2043 start_codon:yes stop_codon:yes gene_type:complete
MALPTSPSIVVLENDVSIYTPNINSSVVGIVGFADKGPTDKATLITSQANLLKTFGKPNSSTMPGQGLEGALEILEATNQIYFVRAADSGKLSASANIDLGVAPAFAVSSNWNPTHASSIYYSVTDNTGTFKVSGTVTVPASSTTFKTKKEVLFNSFDPNLFDDQPVYAGVDGDTLFLASKFAGSGATLQLSSTGADAADTGFRFNPIKADGDVSAIAAGGGKADFTHNGFTVSSVDLKAYSLYPGTGYNLSALRDGSTQGVSVEVVNKSIKDQIVVNNDGSQAETFLGSLVASANDFFEFVLQNDELNAQSDYVYVNAVSSNGDDYAGFPDLISSKTDSVLDVNGAVNVQPRFVKLIEGTYELAGGDSGYLKKTIAEGQVDRVQPDTPGETALIGVAAAQTGMHALDDDSLNISIALVPGVIKDTVQNELITLAETSKNFLALISPPYAVGFPQAAIDWINGKGSRTAAVNSSYAAAYWPWVQVFNPIAGAEEWYDPAIFAARQCVFTDAVSDPWFAPAGLNRGRLTKPTDTEKALNQGDRDALYSNSINPIKKDPVGGIVIFGQKTTQRTPTALDRVNVRRLMIFVRKTLLALGQPFQFEPNDQFTWELVENALTPFISDLIARRAIVEGSVKCDSTTNTPLRVDRNELWCSVSIKPTKVAETVVFEVNLTSQSATIS